MSDIQPMTDDEIRQIQAGFALWVKQPVRAARYFNDFIVRVNNLIAENADLRKRLSDLEKLVTAPSSAQKPKPTAQQTQPKTEEAVI